MKFKEITVCLDMYGCPNRCKHCWLGISPNGNMSVEDIEFAAKQFRPFADSLQIYHWYREPDFRDDYKELYDLCNRLSDKPIEHFELVSFWRLVRDKEYVKWLSSVGVKKAQLTVFGSKETTDRYVGRVGAYDELLEAIEILVDNKISPRIQTFVNKHNINEMIFVEELITRLDLAERCRAFGGEFSFFLHQGSCDGENEKLYDIRVTPDDLINIPKLLEEYTLKYFNRSKILDVFGRTEQSLYEELIEDRSTASYVSEAPVFYIDRNFDVYPNITAPAPHWCLGNLRSDCAAAILENYKESRSVAQRTRLTVPVSEMVMAQGDRASQRLFSKGDYIEYITNKYCRAGY